MWTLFIQKKSLELDTTSNEIKEQINNLKVSKLNKDNLIIKDEISSLKSTINSLKNTISYRKDKFDKLVSFLHSKLHNWYDKDDKYIGAVNDIVLDDEDIEDIGINNEKDDYEL